MRNVGSGNAAELATYVVERASRFSRWPNEHGFLLETAGWHACLPGEKLCGVGQAEEPLPGGNASTGVMRVGDTVRRPAGPHTPAVHELLLYLRAAGFEGAPRPLGIDERGREVLTFIRGTVPWPDRFDLLEPRERLVLAATPSLTGTWLRPGRGCCPQDALVLSSSSASAALRLTDSIPFSADSLLS